MAFPDFFDFFPRASIHSPVSDGKSLKRGYFVFAFLSVYGPRYLGRREFAGQACPGWAVAVHVLGVSWRARKEQPNFFCRTEGRCVGTLDSLCGEMTARDTHSLPKLRPEEDIDVQLLVCCW